VLGDGGRYRAPPVDGGGGGARYGGGSAGLEFLWVGCGPVGGFISGGGR